MKIDDIVLREFISYKYGSIISYEELEAHKNTSEFASLYLDFIMRDAIRKHIIEPLIADISKYLPNKPKER